MNLRKILIVMVLCFATKAIYAGSTPRSTVQSFLNALRAGNMEGVVRCLHGDEYRVFRNKKVDAEGVIMLRLLFQGARITMVENVSRFHSVVYIRMYDPLTGESNVIPLNVKKIDGDWKICDGQ